jgi:hypothetical protein
MEDKTAYVGFVAVSAMLVSVFALDILMIVLRGHA